MRALLERRPSAPTDAQAQSRQKAFRAPELALAVAKLDPPHRYIPDPNAMSRWVPLW